MKRHNYQWSYDRETANKTKISDIVDIKEKGLKLNLERIAFDDYTAVDLGRICVDEPFKISPKDSSHGRSDRVISFISTLSGQAIGQLPSGEQFILDEDWGVLSDFSDGTVDITVQPGLELRTFGAGISFDRLDLILEQNDQPEKQDIFSERNFVKSFRITPEMKSITFKAVNCDFTGPLKRLYLEGLALQFIALVFNQNHIEVFNEQSDQAKSRAIKDALDDAEAMLLQDLANPPTLHQISAYTGLSAHKLNIGFKERYGKTAFEHLAAKRLNAAMEILQQEPNTKVKVLASDFGYAHVSNFISAFKKEFGITPAQFAKQFKESE